MAERFLELLVTPSVEKAQERYHGHTISMPGGAKADALTDDEIQFIRSRDSFYMATVSESGWPYLQHCGGKPGFLHVASINDLPIKETDRKFRWERKS